MNGFTFKQFTIQQHNTAMKVTTDACILGAYASVENAHKILDIGTGTGLLSLMMAQRSKALIEAVEIDNNAYQQALENINHSIFKHQVRIFHQTIQDFAQQQASLSFDVIVSNPPFFQNHLKSSQQNRNKALHTDTLSFEELIDSVIALLSSDGIFIVLLPAYESGVLQQLASIKGLYPNKKLVIRHRKESKILRIITTFGQSESSVVEEELIIKNPDESYTAEFENLLRNYYLIF